MKGSNKDIPLGSGNIIWCMGITGMCFPSSVVGRPMIEWKFVTLVYMLVCNRNVNNQCLTNVLTNEWPQQHACIILYFYLTCLVRCAFSMTVNVDSELNSCAIV